MEIKYELDVIVVAIKITILGKNNGIKILPV